VTIVLSFTLRNFKSFNLMTIAFFFISKNLPAIYAENLYDPYAAISHRPNTRFAFALIRAALDALSLPLRTICVARAFAFAACERSGIGYFLLPGKPNALDFSLLRRAARSLAMLHRIDISPAASFTITKD
jgi:hypothetical protein